jgi:hypothetical protein
MGPDGGPIPGQTGRLTVGRKIINLSQYHIATSRHEYNIELNMKTWQGYEKQEQDEKLAMMY